MNNFFKLITGMTLILLSNTALSWQAPVLVEGAIEVEPSSLSVYFLGKSLNGSIHGKVCEDCELEKLSITPKTKAFKGQKEVMLSSMVDESKKPDLVLFDLKTKKVTRLVWY